MGDRSGGSNNTGRSVTRATEDAGLDGVWTSEHHFTDEYLSATMPTLVTLVGTPEDVAEEPGEYRDALGEDVHFVFRPYAPGTDTEEPVECVERLGEEIAPRL